MSNPYDGLVLAAQPGQSLMLRDGSITSASPVRVLLDGDTDAVAMTKAPLISGIATGQRVCVMQVGRQLLILGRYGG